MSRAACSSEDFESGLGNWAVSGTWGLTGARYHSPGFSATDSPGSYYANETDSALEYVPPFDLSSASRPTMSFWHRLLLETDYDFATIEVSTDSGDTWDELAAYTGVNNSFTREQVDLSAYIGQSNVRFRFRLVTDTSVVMDGWYLDDLCIGEAPAPVVLSTPVAMGQNSVSLQWSESASAEFEAYRIYRSRTAETDWRSAHLVAEITDQSTVAATDITVVPKTAYYYYVMVLTTEGLHSLSNEETVTTPAGMDYPFLDNGEGGPAAWVADPPWALSNEEAFSPGNAWSDSPGGEYANSITSQSLTLVAPMDFSGAVSPVLSFNQLYSFASGDVGNVEISLNSGTDWTTLGAVTGDSSGAWLRNRIDLTAYAGQPSVLIRFRLTTNSSGTADGSHLDDISVSESPTVVSAPVLDQITSHSVRLTWGANSDLVFSHYAIFRSTSSGVDINDTLVATVEDQNTLTYTDTGLALDTLYYYRVYAVNPYGAFSPDSAQESSVRTLNNPLPFNDGFEGSLENWNFTGTWDVTDAYAHEGEVSLTDSPGSNYSPSTDTWAQTALDLTGTTWPVLRFRDRHALAASDWGYLEVSTNGTSWTSIYGVSGTRGEWGEQSIDLSPWKNESNLRIRFHMTTDYNVTTLEDGWYIDELSVAEHDPVSIPYPFYEGFEDGALANWLHSSWVADTDDPYEGTYAVHDTQPVNIPPGTNLWLPLGGELDLSGATDPQLTFWVRGHLYTRSYFRTQVSVNGGVTWADLSASINYDWNMDWTRMQTSLSGYAGQTVRLRLLTYSPGGYAPDEDIFLDNIAIEEAPTAVTLLSAIPSLRSVDLDWSDTTLGGAFRSYEVYRATHANVTVADTLIYSGTEPLTSSFTDTGLSIGATYYYKVFAVNTNDTYNGSNEFVVTTVPLTLDETGSLDDLTQWEASGEWTETDAEAYAGPVSFTDSPGGQYTTSTDTAMVTAVNLTGSDWPVLRFWDRHAIAAGDWGYLEVSPNGTSWSSIYGVSGTREAWGEQVIDLSPWKNESNLRIRFRMTTDYNAATVDDGWYVDAISLAEHDPVSIPYPFHEDFESGALANWLHAAWTPDTDNPYEGTYAVHDTQPVNIPPGTNLWLPLGGELDLSGATDPQLTFWVRGHLYTRSYFRTQVSVNGGVSWADLSASINYDWNMDWTRMQASLSGYAGQTVRLRLLTYSPGGYAPDEDIFLDNIAIEEAPTAVTLLSVTPSLRSVELDWSDTTLGGAFRSYEVYRATHANVTVGDTLIYSETEPLASSFTDTGLSIGATYYYRVFVANTNDTYNGSNEFVVTTVPLTLDETGSLDDLTQWEASGEWTETDADAYSGPVSFTDSPEGQYTTSTDTAMVTAVNLTGSDWPVLRFWDRHAIAAGDWGYLEVSPNGTSWTSIYGVSGTREAWGEQAIDLSPWKNEANLRIRFHMTTDYNAATLDDGWYVDAISLVEHDPVSIPYPFYEDFESGALANWLHAAWTPDTDNPYEGTYAVHDTQPVSIPPGTNLWLPLGGELDLSGATDPQLTFWVRGHLYTRSYFRTQVSVNGGVSWTDLSASINYDWNMDWTRMQASLSGYAGQIVRLRLLTYSPGGYAPDEDIFLDNIAIEEAPTAVTLNPIEEITTTDLKLIWSKSMIPDFKEYRVYRSETSTVDENSVLLTTITDPNITEFTDTGLQVRKYYYYRIFVYNTHDTGNGSNQASALTLGVPLGWSDSFGDNLPEWTYTGEWTEMEDAGLNNSIGLVDSPGDYSTSSSSYALTAVDLTDAVWPVLSFWDRHAFAGGDWGYLEISSNAGGSWTRVYGVSATRNTWAEQQVDLSPWKGQPQVWIRFIVYTDYTTPGDGWYIDDVSISEKPAAPSGYPYFEDFENGMDNWLHAAWTVDTDQPYEGNYAAHDTVPVNIPPDTQLWLPFAREIDLSEAVDPQLTFMIRGHLQYRSYFRTQVSTNGGIAWTDLPASINYDWNADWTQMQVSLSGYIGQTIRLRFISYSTSGTAPDEDIFLDNIGIGEPGPGAPALHSPENLGIVNVVRPELTVFNAVDFQSDSLTYRFEVYSDETLTTLVAQVPVVSSGAETTSWQVDTNLPDNSTFWWRCRATDDSENSGPWMPTASFYVNEVNNKPYTVIIAGPPNGSVLADLGALLSWYPTTDPDEVDFIIHYHIQVDDDALFGSPEIDDGTIELPASPGAGFAATEVLENLSGSANLVSGTQYYWRIRAEDSRHSFSDWTSGTNTFWFGGPPPTPIEVWLQSWFAPNDPNSAPGADPDHDGIINVMEFAFGLDPTASTTEFLPEYWIDGDDRLCLTYPQRIGGSGTIGIDYTADRLTYIVEVTDNPASGAWNTGSEYVEFLPDSVVDNGDGTETVTVRTIESIAANPSLFMRLRVQGNDF